MQMMTRGQCSSISTPTSREHDKYLIMTMISEVPCVSILVRASVFVKNLHHIRVWIDTCKAVLATGKKYCG